MQGSSFLAFLKEVLLVLSSMSLGCILGWYSRRSCWVGLWVSLRSDWFQGREESVWQKVFQTWRTGSVVFIWFLRRWDAWLLGTMVKANACSMEVMKVVL